jgi:peroxiredoxin
MQFFKGFIIIAVMAMASACVTIPAEAAPANFQLHDMQANGGLYDSNAHMGQQMVLEFYFNGCPACEQNAPKLAQVAQRWRPAGVEVVEVSIDCDRSDYDAWLGRHHQTWPILNDCDRNLAHFFGVSAYPTTVVLKKDHELAWKTVGVWSQATQARIEQILRQGQ